MMKICPAFHACDRLGMYFAEALIQPVEPFLLISPVSHAILLPTTSLLSKTCA